MARRSPSPSVPQLPPPYRLGELVALDLGELHRPDVPLEVIEVDVDRRRLLLRFPSGGTLYVSFRSRSLSPHRKANP